jgi:hypothetical protein
MDILFSENEKKKNGCLKKPVTGMPNIPEHHANQGIGF